MNISFKLKENTIPDFKPKINIPFAALKSINTEADRLENHRVIDKKRLFRMGCACGLY